MWAVVDHMLSGLVIGVGVLGAVLGLVVAGFGVARKAGADDESVSESWAQVSTARDARL